MPIAELGDVRIRYERYGDRGDPVVLVHGSWVDHRTFDRIAPVLGDSMRVLAYDRRGYGGSTGPTRAHPVKDDAEDLANFLVATDLYPAHVVAHSYGGCVAFHLAGSRPELVRAVVAHEPPCLGFLEDDPATALEAQELRAGVAQLRRALRQGEIESAARGFVTALARDPGAWDRMPVDGKATFLANAPHWLEEVSDPETDRPELSGLSEAMSPVLLTEGADSPPFLRRMTEALARRLRNVKVQQIPDVGHFPHLTRPAQYIGLLHRFLVERDVPAM